MFPETLHQVSQHVIENSPTQIILHLIGRIDTAGHYQLLTAAVCTVDAQGDILPRRERRILAERFASMPDRGLSDLPDSPQEMHYI
jgi:hypothetical protein